MKLSPSIPSIALVLLLVLAPIVSAQGNDANRPTTDVTMYGHMFLTQRDSPQPMNTEFPAGEEDISRGYAGHNCGWDPSGQAVPSCEDDVGNEVWFYSTAGFVDITEFEDFTYENVHNERGLTKDIIFDTSKNVKGRVYMSADLHGWLLLFCDNYPPNDIPWPVWCWNWDPGYLPQWQVEATVYAGILGEYGGEANTPPPIAQSFASGGFEIIAQGVSQPIDITSLEATGNPTVWAIDVDLGTPQMKTMAKEKSLIVRFQWWSVTNGERVIVPELMSWNINGGEFYPPQIVLPVKNAFDVELVVPQFVHNKLVILGIINTPWGSYDVDPASVTVTIEKGSTEITPVSIEKLADYSVAHGGHYKPVNVTWVWDYKKDKLGPGTYTVIVEGSNWQHSARAKCEGAFTIAPDGLPGKITIGECGARTITEGQLEKVSSGAAGDASSESTLPTLPPLGLASASIVEVGSGTSMINAALAVLGLAFVALRRRWSS